MGEVTSVEIENVRLDCKVGGDEPKSREELEVEWRREWEERMESERRQERNVDHKGDQTGNGGHLEEGVQAESEQQRRGKDETAADGVEEAMGRYGE